MRWKYFKNKVWVLTAPLAAPVFTGTIPAERLDQYANYWPWMALGGILIVLTAIARYARRPSEV